MTKKIVISGVGCCLVDLIYNDIDFNGDIVQSYQSLQRGDGGLTPGQLVFQEEFEKFAQSDFNYLLRQLTAGNEPSKKNIGGPSIVSLIHAAQVLPTEKFEVRFYGRGGKDDAGYYLLESLKNTPVILKNYELIDRITPSTVVLSDPNYDHGHGERMFINSIGAAWECHPELLDEEFFQSEIVVFGGTALVPDIHDQLTLLLKKSKKRGAITVVNTVFDFRSEKNSPGNRWKLGESDDSYASIDLLITDQEEALRLSGKSTLEEAVTFFQKKKVSALIITNGSKNVYLFSDGRLFKAIEPSTLPVSQQVTRELKEKKGGDTTGCGDNFAGGVLASLAHQLEAKQEQPDLKEACCQGIVAGGFACFYMGGTFFESETGEKQKLLQPYYHAYNIQLDQMLMK